jgi:metal-responsive CopG/Arc/MetJ family transcriptional regulator
MAKKIIQVPIGEHLLSDLNKYSKKQKKTRAEFIREACKHYVAETEEAEMDKQYVEGYRKFPESAETPASCKASNSLLAFRGPTAMNRPPDVCGS